MDISSGKRLHSYGKIYHVKWENSQFRLGHFQWPTVELPEDTSGKWHWQGTQNAMGEVNVPETRSSYGSVTHQARHYHHQRAYPDLIPPFKTLSIPRGEECACSFWSSSTVPPFWAWDISRFTLASRCHWVHWSPNWCRIESRFWVIGIVTSPASAASCCRVLQNRPSHAPVMICHKFR